MVDIPFDYSQADWGSRFWYADGTKDPWNVDKWVLHYGGGANVAGSLEKAEAWCDTYGDDRGVERAFPSVQNEMFMLRRWQSYHVDSLGWTDIAYNYGLGQSGKLYRLRGENRSGATSGDYENDGIPENYEARAVVWIGGAGQEPTPEAYAAFQRLWAADPLDVIGHSDVKATGCPGDYWRTYIHGKAYEKEEAVETPPATGEEDSMFVKLGDEGPMVEYWQDQLAYIDGQDIRDSARIYLPALDPPMTVGVYDDNMAAWVAPYNTGGNGDGIGPGEAIRIQADFAEARCRA